MWIQTEVDGKQLWQVREWLEIPWLVHGFTSREWGNLALHAQDGAGVLVNRNALAQAFDTKLENWVMGSQVHKDTIATVSHQVKEPLTETDGLVTTAEHLFLVSFYADCVPLLFLSSESKVVAMAHAGWRGTVLRIGAKMVKLLVDKYDLSPDTLQVAIGPSIGRCCYTVGEEVIKHFPASVWVKEGTGFKLDLKLANWAQLLESGIKEENIHVSSVCTHCEELCYSHRREQQSAGRMAAFLMKS